MNWDMPWYSAQQSLDTLLVGRQVGMFHLVCYLRVGERVFETYWTNGRGVEAMDNSYGLLDLTAYGRQEPWQDSPEGWPQQWGTDGGHPYRVNARPIAQWSRLSAAAARMTSPRVELSAGVLWLVGRRARADDGGHGHDPTSRHVHRRRQAL